MKTYSQAFTSKVGTLHSIWVIVVVFEEGRHVVFVFMFTLQMILLALLYLRLSLLYTVYYDISIDIAILNIQIYVCLLCYALCRKRRRTLYHKHLGRDPEIGWRSSFSSVKTAIFQTPGFWFQHVHFYLADNFRGTQFLRRTPCEMVFMVLVVVKVTARAERGFARSRRRGQWQSGRAIARFEGREGGRSGSRVTLSKCYWQADY